ncbi:TetR family transcriptional regulator [Miltoncostaea marina]|uniref:TetR family transcriptional regulator n=1 Tax=Miltoncostaea marina TaxID=2843215 RepID=UPI001C3E09E5|nr:TetR family transcriptional regulator [Miltoncostaea marina]
MARPRTIDDERLVAAAVAAISRRGPGFTVAEVAAGAGVAAGTLIARFGSRRGMLEAVWRTASAGSVRRMREAADAAGPGAGAVLAAMLAGAEAIDDPDVAANHLAQLGADLADPVLRGLVRDDLAARRDVLAGLVAAAPDLPRAPSPAAAADLLLAVVNGAQLAWSLEPRGALAARLRRDLGELLGAWGAP